MKEINISQVDALFANGSYPIEFLFYFKEKINTTNIRAALKKVSSDFWPIFGDYKDGKIYFDEYDEVACYDEESIAHEFNIADAEHYNFEYYSRFSLPELKKLFYFKVIQFKNGMVLIPKINHLTGDGYSYFYFLSVLAMYSLHGAASLKSSLFKLIQKPHHNRTALKKFRFKGITPPSIIQNDNLIIEREEISRKTVQSIIKEAASSEDHRISMNDILSASALKKIVSTQRDFWQGNVRLTIPIDVRRYVKKYGQRFFGNGIMLHSTGFQKTFIENSSAEEIAVAIRKSMPTLSDETYIDYLSGLENMIHEKGLDKFRPFDPGTGCLVTNLSRLPADKLNFGTGCPELIDLLTIGKNSTAILSKDENFVLRFAY